MSGAIPPFPPKLALAIPPTRIYAYPFNSLQECRIYSRPALALTSVEGARRIPIRPWVLPPARVLNELTPAAGGLPRDIHTNNGYRISSRMMCEAYFYYISEQEKL
jgi:hypothetical protein